MKTKDSDKCMMNGHIYINVDEQPFSLQAIVDFSNCISKGPETNRLRPLHLVEELLLLLLLLLSSLSLILAFALDFKLQDSLETL